MPFAGLLVKAANALVPGDDEETVREAKFLDIRIIETPTIAIGQAKKEIMRMASFVQDNLSKARHALVNSKFNEIDYVLGQEQKINKLERELTDYLDRKSTRLNSSH